MKIFIYFALIIISILLTIVFFYKNFFPVIELSGFQEKTKLSRRVVLIGCSKSGEDSAKVIVIDSNITSKIFQFYSLHASNLASFSSGIIALDEKSAAFFIGLGYKILRVKFLLLQERHPDCFFVSDSYDVVNLKLSNGKLYGLWANSSGAMFKCWDTKTQEEVSIDGEVLSKQVFARDGKYLYLGDSGLLEIPSSGHPYIKRGMRFIDYSGEYGWLFSLPYSMSNAHATTQVLLEKGIVSIPRSMNSRWGSDGNVYFVRDDDLWRFSPVTLKEEIVFNNRNNWQFKDFSFNQDASVMVIHYKHDLKDTITVVDLKQKECTSITLYNKALIAISAMVWHE